MKIESLHIYSFGKLKDLRLNLNEGINLIEGQNEAGKSTIMAFIRSILFGFESRRIPHLRYEPLLGGQLGGAVNILDENNNIHRIERIYNRRATGDVKIYLPDGEIRDEDYLTNFLGNTNDKVFKQIFSFSLTELQQIENLEDEQINDFIYHAGTGAVKQILSLKQQLEQNRQRLYKKSGRNPEVNLILAELDETFQELMNIKKNNVNYQYIADSIKELEEKISKSEQEQEFKNSSLNWLEKVIHFHDTFLRIKQIEQELKSFPNDFQFPNNGVERLQNFTDRLDDLKVEYQQLTEKSKTLKQEIDNTEYDSFYDENIIEVTALREELSSHKERKNKINSIKFDLNKLKQNINHNLGQLGSGFSEEILDQTDYSIHDKQTLQDLSGNLEQKQREINDINREIEHKKNRYQELLQLMDKLKNEKEEITVDNNFLASFLKIKDLWQKLKDKNWQKEKLSEQIALFANDSNRKSKNTVSFYYLGGLSTIIFLLGIILILLNQLTSGFILTATGLLSFIVLIFGKVKFNSATGVNSGAINNQIKQLEQEIAEIQLQAKNLLDPFAFKELNENTIESLTSLYENQLEKKQILREKETRIEEYMQEINLAAADIEKKEKNKREPLLTELNRIKADWESWLKNHHLDSKLSRVIVFDVMSLIQNTKELLNQHKNLESLLQKVNAEIEEYKQKVETLIEENQLNIYGTTEEIVYYLAEGFKRNQEAKLKLEHWQENAEQLNEQISKLNRRMIVEESRISELFKYANVSDSESFYHQAEKFEQYQRLTDELKRLKQNIQSGSKNDEEYQKLLQELDTQDKEEMLKKIEALKSSLQEINSNIKKMLEEKGEFQNSLNQMEQDHKLSELNQKYNNLQTKLKEKVKEWAVFSITNNILDKTMAVYETEKQPDVIRRTSEHFRQMSENKYHKVIAPIDKKNIEVIREDGLRILPQYLSRGTTEQLYLAVRIALVEEFSKYKVLPVILDDIFVNFDNNRLLNALMILNKLAERHQIILFTCHSHMAKSIIELSADINHISLN